MPTKSNVVPGIDHPHPDELMEDITQPSLTKPLVIAIIVHVLLIGGTSIPFMLACCEYGTMDPTEITKLKKEEQKKKQKAQQEATAGKGVGKASGQKASSGKADAATQTAATGGSTGEAKPDRKARAQAKLEEVSKERPKDSDVGLDDVDILE